MLKCKFTKDFFTGVDERVIDAVFDWSSSIGTLHTFDRGDFIEFNINDGEKIEKHIELAFEAKTDAEGKIYKYLMFDLTPNGDTSIKKFITDIDIS